MRKNSMATFAFTDIHGCKRLYDAIIKYCMESDPNCTIVFTGDACDRGEDGYAIMKDLLARENVVYLKGNHEDMFIKAARAFRTYCEEERYYQSYSSERIKGRLKRVAQYNEDIKLCIYNGGASTILAWAEDGFNMHFVNQIAKLPLVYSYDQIDFSHAGGVFPSFKRIKENDNPDEYDIENILWDRHSFGFAWENDRLLVHGHTPVIHMPARYSKVQPDLKLMDLRPALYRGNIDERFNGFKLNLDMGTFASGLAFVFNCDSKEVIGFYDDKIINKESDKEIQNICKYKVEA